MRKTIACIVRAYWDFIRKHPLLSLPVSLIMLAACAGALYLIIVNFPRYMPCLTASCG